MCYNMYTWVNKADVDEALSGGIDSPPEDPPTGRVVNHIEETRPPGYPPREAMITLVPYETHTDANQVLVEVDPDQIQGDIWTVRVAPLEELTLSSPDNPEMLAHRYWDSMVRWKPSRNIGTSHEVVVDGRIPADAISISAIDE